MHSLFNFIIEKPPHIKRNTKDIIHIFNDMPNQPASNRRKYQSSTNINSIMNPRYDKHIHHEDKV